MSAYYDDERELTYSDLLRAYDHRDPQFAELVVRYLSQPDPPESKPEEPPATGDASSAADEQITDFDQAFDDDSDVGGAGQGQGQGEDDDDDDDDFDDDGEDEDDDDDFDNDDDDDFGDNDFDSTSSDPSLPPDAWTLGRLRSAVGPHSMWGKSAAEKQAQRKAAWEALMAAPYPPPRLRLGELFIKMYEAGDEWSRGQLVGIFREATVGWGLWKGLKHIYKLAEERHDAEIFGVLAWRLDAIQQTERRHSEISPATFGYMRRRAWRYLRQLGQAVPELYPQFAVEVMRHYPRYFRFSDSWVANQIWAHKDLIGARSAWMSEPPKKLDRRAFDDAWKISPEPLLRLLEDSPNDAICNFAIRSLRSDFPETLRKVDPQWLARIGKKDLESVHTFVVEVLTESPEFHQSRLKELGLHDMVVGLLRSGSDKAAAYAVEYAKAHAPNIPVDELVEIAELGGERALAFVKARLEAKSPAELGLPALVRMLAASALTKLAKEKLDAGFSPDDLTAELYVALANGSSEQQSFVKAFYKNAKKKVPAEFLRAQVEDPSLSYWELSSVMRELGTRKAKDIGIAWIQEKLFDSRLGDYVAEWLQKGILKGDELDAEWVKGLAMRPSRRALALEILGNKKFIAPHAIGLPWLLAMARQADESLSSFAHRYLLEHFAPDDFALEAGSKDVQVGIASIWSLLGTGQPEPVRRFAATYLRAHHPDLGPATDEARQLGIKPRLPRESYTLARVRPLFNDLSAEVRRLARDIGRRELVRWNQPAFLYELASSQYREGRQLSAEALLHIGETDADPAVTPPVEWLDPARVFALAESPIKATREVAVTLIRRHYGRLGGAHKLAWLMESPDREVRLFAVRLLWDQHRPLATPKGAPDGDRRFDSEDALRHFARTVLFGLPPGRMERREGGEGALPERPLPASVAKRRLIDVVRDMAVEDRAFAAMIVPVLDEFVSSQAKGEWQGCVAALAQIRRAHPSVDTALPEPLALARVQSPLG